MNKLMTINDLCEYLSVSKSTVYEWTHVGCIPHYKLPRGVRFKVSEIDLAQEKAYQRPSNLQTRHSKTCIFSLNNTNPSRLPTVIFSQDCHILFMIISHGSYILYSKNNRVDSFENHVIIKVQSS